MKRFTEEELDALLGPRRYVSRCSQCKRTKGPYYSRAMALDAINEHESWGHLRKLGSSVASGNTTKEAEDDGG